MYVYMLCAAHSMVLHCSAGLQVSIRSPHILMYCDSPLILPLSLPSIVHILMSVYVAMLRLILVTTHSHGPCDCTSGVMSVR